MLYRPAVVLLLRLMERQQRVSLMMADLPKSRIHWPVPEPKSRTLRARSTGAQ